jgi:hypothetical protein
LWTIPIT